MISLSFPCPTTLYLKRLHAALDDTDTCISTAVSAQNQSFVLLSWGLGSIARAIVVLTGAGRVLAVLPANYVDASTDGASRWRM